MRKMENIFTDSESPEKSAQRGGILREIHAANQALDKSKGFLIKLISENEKK